MIKKRSKNTQASRFIESTASVSPGGRGPARSPTSITGAAGGAGRGSVSAHRLIRGVICPRHCAGFDILPPRCSSRVLQHAGAAPPGTGSPCNNAAQGTRAWRRFGLCCTVQFLKAGVPAGPGPLALAPGGQCPPHATLASRGATGTVQCRLRKSSLRALLAAALECAGEFKYPPAAAVVIGTISGPAIGSPSPHAARRDPRGSGDSLTRPRETQQDLHSLSRPYTAKCSATQSASRWLSSEPSEPWMFT